MYFDVPKVVRSPGYDYGHDEESRNGRDIKIDILDGYIWTPERFRRSLEPREVTGTPREVYGPYWAHVGGREKEQGKGACPPKPNPNWGGGRRADTLGCSFLLSTKAH